MIKFVFILFYYFVGVFICVFLLVLLRNTAILVALCNALARGLILPWIPKPIVKIDEKKVIEEGPTKRKKAAKVHEKPASGPTLSVDPGGILDIKSAIEVHFFHCISPLHGEWVA